MTHWARLERAHDVFTLCRFKCGDRLSPFPCRCLQFSERDVQFDAWRKNHRTLDQVFQPVDVAWPGITAQGHRGPGRDGETSSVVPGKDGIEAHHT